MKKTYLFLTAICSVLLSTTPVTSEASIYPEYYAALRDQTEIKGSWTEFEGSWLLWKPCLSGVNAAATVTQSGSDKSVKYHDFDPDWQNGFRVGINTPNMFRSWGIALNYSRMNISSLEKQFFENNDANNGIVSSLIAQGAGFPNTWGSGREHLDLLYQDWNLLISYNLRCNKHTFTPYFGLAGLYLTEKIKGTFTGTDQSLKTSWSLSFSSIGFRTGTKYNYAFSDCFGFYADASLAMLENVDKITSTQTLDGEGGEKTFPITENNCRHQIYGHRLAAGLKYKGVVCCWTYNMHLGYELASWYKLPQPRVLFGGQNAIHLGQTTSTRGAEITFHGLVWGCLVTF